MKTDNELTFKPHARSFCKKASQKLKAFTRIACSLSSNVPAAYMFHNQKFIV